MTTVIPAIYHDLPATSFQLRPRLPGIPTLLKVRLGIHHGASGTSLWGLGTRSSTASSGVVGAGVGRPR